METGFPKTQGVKIIDSSEGLNSELPEGHSHDDGHDHGGANSHIWDKP